MPLQVINPTKPILGYALKERIGSGGYGEVWAAEAPGGLPKAIKFIFGFHDEKRAQGELKALNRIRSVRHPFLLSLERIDVVDGQMVVITELADMCLKARFEQCVESGLDGIPRAELLGYLRDAASALDFISDEFKLQHLDVKPENLLLLSDHIKVADFGLVKDIHDGTQSLMSGLTPAYAPPELFDGRPNKSSDQYSLAIVFQEMLTGMRPFDGRTAAQLASQHLKERPNLRALPREDQAIISRALSKDPDVRFPSCAAMVSELMTDKSQQSATQPRTRTKLRDGKRRRRSKHTRSTLTLTGGTRPFELTSTETTKLPALEYQTDTARFRPTLFLGVGNTGTKIVRQIRRRLNERDGSQARLPAIRLLCIDTDTGDLASSCHRGTNDGLTSNEAFQLPLRRPEEYREDANMHLAWLSRRWIYNVPKSLRTEGIRPLGRLAMATHIEELSIRLRRVLSDLVKPEHLAETADTLELEPTQQPRVVIVGSISGGTCSGVGIDLAYIVRAILRQLGVINEDVLGFFTHASTFRDQQRELPIANSLAFLNELYHFSCVEEYPGDESCGIPPSTDGTTTFTSTYLMHLGDDLDQQTYAEQIDSIAEYLYLNSATVCGTFFDTCRQAENETQGLPLRTMALYRSGEGQTDIIVNSAHLLGQQVIRDWTTESALDKFDATETATELLQQHTATVETIVNLVHETMNHVLKDPVETVSRALLEQFSPEDGQRTKDQVSRAADSIFGIAHSSVAPTTKLGETIDSLCGHFSEDRIPKIVECILNIVDKPGPRLSGASKVAAEIKQRLEDQQQQLKTFITANSRDIERSYSRLLTTDPIAEEDAPDFFTNLAESLLQRFTLESVQRITKSIQPAIAQANESIEDFKIQFEYATSHRPADEPGTSQPIEFDSPSIRFQQRVLTELQERLPKLAHRVEQHLQHNMLDQHGGLRAVLSNVNLRSEFQVEFDEATRATIVEQLKEVSAEELFDDQLRTDDIAKWMAGATRPRLIDCGGAIRWMHAYPKRAKPVDELVNHVQNEIGQQLTPIPATIGELVSCVEAERVPLDNVAMHLLRDCPDSIEFASRLHTRVDIAWTHISSMR